MQECTWKEFALNEVFNIKATRSGIDRNKLIAGKGNTPYITRSDANNGWDSFICEQPNYSKDNGNVLSIGLDTQTVFYQPCSFYTGQNIQVLSNPQLNKYVAAFIIPLLKIRLQKFNWGGNGATLGRLKRSKLLFPVTSDGTPDWQYMEDYMRAVEHKLLAQALPILQERVNKQSNIQLPILEKQNWKEFAFTDVFVIKDGYYNKKPPFDPNGNIPFLGATQYDNGITGFYTLPTIQKYDKVGTIDDSDKDNRIYKGNCIAVTNDGSVGNAYYQHIPFTCSHSITPLYLKHYTLNRYIALFLIPLIMKSGESFEYGRKWRPKRMRKSHIILPVTQDGTPDYTYMENYMRSLEAQQLRHYLTYKK